MTGPNLDDDMAELRLQGGRIGLYFWQHIPKNDVGDRARDQLEMAFELAALALEEKYDERQVRSED